MAFSDYRSRLFLITPSITSNAWSGDSVKRYEAAFASTRIDDHENQDGDVGCVLLDGDTSNEQLYTERAEPLVRYAQKKNVAALIMANGHIAKTLDADGVHVTDPKAMDTNEQNRLQNKGLIVGCGGINTRHLALTTGEREFDYLFFGRTDHTDTPETHPKTTTLAHWWAQMMALPCVALSGTQDAAFEQLAENGVEFIALRDQIWTAENPITEVIRLNAKLDEIARTRMAAAAARQAQG